MRKRPGRLHCALSFAICHSFFATRFFHSPPKEKSTMKLIVRSAKPRNPCVVPSLRRKAGSHQPGQGALRMKARAHTRREVAHALAGDSP